MALQTMSESRGGVNGAVSAPASKISSFETTGKGDPMKFSNGGVSLDRAVERVKGKVALANASLLFDTSF